QYNKKLGTFELTGIPPAPRAVPQIEVTFDIDANGIVHVSAKALGTGKEQSMTITGGSALPKEDIERMMRDAQEHAEEDKRRREEAETRNLAEQALWQTEKFLAESGDKLPEDSRTSVNEALGNLRAALGGSDTAAIKSAHDSLNSAMQEASTKLSSPYRSAAAARPPPRPPPRSRARQSRGGALATGRWSLRCRPAGWRRWSPSVRAAGWACGGASSSSTPPARSGRSARSTRSGWSGRSPAPVPGIRSAPPAPRTRAVRVTPPPRVAPA